MARMEGRARKWDSNTLEIGERSLEWQLKVDFTNVQPIDGNYFLSLFHQP